MSMTKEQELRDHVVAFFRGEKPLKETLMILFLIVVFVSWFVL